ncbi:SDR family oxidoreductase [Streptomyces malaysiense]|uniref:3-beta hydroxysteroid dehydrogenase n=1 Tax=Streptomyces malaysiense TaxID=1428626 RepID=A0A1J4Q5G1_9ACTN|nr:SDR family oxidoreductase [Streptomyces malaysiense]OIK28233.1 3-beta hydroxysteroid dehydrogenase [Streptomyces malaysiense]
MRVFVTGASGWIGSAVVPELIGAGHQVVGLARSDSSAESLTAAGAEVVRGGLDDLDVLRAAAAGSDGVIHLAFKHDVAFSGGFQSAAEADRRAVDVLTDALADSDRPFVLASGLAGLKPGQVATEQDMPVTEGDSPVLIRAVTAQAVLACARRGVRSSVVRLSPTCHGDGDNGFMTFLIGVAREKGVSGYPGTGANRWSAVHRLDAARLFRLAIEKAPAGTVLHGVAEEGVPLREIAEVIGRRLKLPTAPVGAEDLAGHFGWMSGFVALDAPASNAATRALLGWDPTGPSLLADLEEGHYFRAAEDGAV